jgi:hypothetical protein
MKRFKVPPLSKHKRWLQWPVTVDKINWMTNGDNDKEELVGQVSYI